MLQAANITGLVLAGGQGSRMGGIDKGLQPFQGQALAKLAWQRLAPQVGSVAINANRHLDTYRGWGAPVWSDAADQEAFAGPLAGFLSGLSHCTSDYLCTVACDTPLFPQDLVARLAKGLQAAQADIAMAAGPEGDGRIRTQPVFCLIKTELRPALLEFMQQGGRKIDAWTASQRSTVVRFDQPGDDPRAFFNINTLRDLDQLESLAASAKP